MKIKKTKEKGVILIIAFLVLGILLFLGTYFLSFALTEHRISKSQEIAARTFYLAEAGINEAIWKLKHDNTTLDNDPPWAICFVTSTSPCPDCATWTASFTRKETLFPGGSFEVSIRNLECARGRITATSTIALPGGKFSQRVVRTIVRRAIGSPIRDAGLFTGDAWEDLSIRDSKVRIDHGNVFSNNHVIVADKSSLEVRDNPATAGLEGQILALRDILIERHSSVTSTARCARNICTLNCRKCPPDRIIMPAIDFDSVVNPNSLKNRARTAQGNLRCAVLCNGIVCSNKCIFTESEFRGFLEQVGVGGVLTLNNAITYVEGEVKLKRGRELIVNGILAVDDNIEIGERDPRSHITVNQPGPGRASGLLVKREIEFEKHTGFLGRTIEITGVIYALRRIELDKVPERIKIRGGVLSNAIRISELKDWLEIVVDNDKISRVLHLTQPPGGGAPVMYSPTIAIEHWEEVY